MLHNSETYLDMLATKSADDVLSDSFAIPPPIVGIYFLIDAGEIVYVGQSVDVMTRIASHKREGKVFDKINILPCRIEDLDMLEASYIIKFNPKLNGNVPSGGFWMSGNKIAYLVQDAKGCKYGAARWIGEGRLQMCGDVGVNGHHAWPVVADALKDYVDDEMYEHGYMEYLSLSDYPLFVAHRHLDEFENA